DSFFKVTDPELPPPVISGGIFGINLTALPGSYPVQQATNPLVVSGSGTFGGTAVLAATLNENGLPLAGKTISFNLNNGSTSTVVGMATPAQGGMAMLTGVRLPGITAAFFSGAVPASFAGASTEAASPSSGDPPISPVTPTIPGATPA